MTYNPKQFSLWQMLLYTLIGAPCALVTLALQSMNAPYGAQSMGGSQMNTDAFLTLAIAVNRIVEAIKQNVLERVLTGEANAQARAGLALVLSMLFGILGAFMFSLNLFAEFTNVPAWAGILVSGFVVAGGSNLVHAAIELITQIRDLLNARTGVVQGQARSINLYPQG